MNQKKDLTDIFLDKLKYISISICLILLMISWSAMATLSLLILNIDIDSLPILFKIIYTLIFDIIFLIIIIYLYKKEIKNEFNSFFNKKTIIKNLKKVIFYWSLGLAIMVTFNLIISGITSSLATNEQAVRDMIDKYPLYMAFQVMIYAPITEEIIFRKSISKITNNKYIYILLSGLIFGGLHVLPSITSPLDLLYLLPYCSLGFTFALLYKNTNNIFYTITAHSIHNTLALLVYLI